MTAPIRVLLVDDHAVVREGYRRLLEATPEIRVVAEANNGEDACVRFMECSPDVVVMDITLPGTSGFEALRRILGRQPAARVLMFSMHEDPLFVLRALDGGARGYLTKASAPDMMVEAVRSIAGGSRFVPLELVRKLQDRALSEEQLKLDALSEREFEVLRLLAAGQGLAEIAAMLCVSSKTVANYQTNIRQKLGCDNAMQLLRIALTCGLADSYPAAAGTSIEIPGRDATRENLPRNRG
ncbi:MAG: response regulator transcription factor [Betaproteobacteria bacterium]|nr:response regulator transcription factor [Betaproteobacteria bacterium]